jgi:hypothetical protein
MGVTHQLDELDAPARFGVMNASPTNFVQPHAPVAPIQPDAAAPSWPGQ